MCRFAHRFSNSLQYNVHIEGAGLLTDANGTTVPIEIFSGDLTRETTDAIVNAANTRLAGGGGVDGAIHRAAGPQLLEACREIGGCETGDAVVTPGFELAAQYVIHTVGPVWNGGGGGEEGLLASCHTRSLSLASEYGLESVAFPAISCGVYGYPIEQAAYVAIGSVRSTLDSGRVPSVRRVRFVLFADDVLAAFSAVARETDGAEVL